jgi:hypothetical protein
MTTRENISRTGTWLLASTAAAVMLGACGGSRQPSADTAAPGTTAAAPAANDTAPASDSTTPGADTTMPAPASTSNTLDQQQAALDAREQELARREADLEKNEAVLASTRTHVTTPKATRPAASTLSSSNDSVIAKQPSATLASNSSPASRTDSTVSRAGGPSSYVVPAGTALQIELAQTVNTKKAQVGDTVSARLHAPVMVGSVDAVETGSQVTGTVTQVVSGSSKIGGVPMLALSFDSLVAEDGSKVPISAKFVQQGTSDTAKDTAKIAGGAVAGAVVGHQVDSSNKGTIIGGILGGAAGAAAAQKTGGEVKLPTGTVLSVTTDSSFTVQR